MLMLPAGCKKPKTLSGWTDRLRHTTTLRAVRPFNDAAAAFISSGECKVGGLGCLSLSRFQRESFFFHLRLSFLTLFSSLWAFLSRFHLSVFLLYPPLFFLFFFFFLIVVCPPFYSHGKKTNKQKKKSKMRARIHLDLLCPAIGRPDCQPALGGHLCSSLSLRYRCRASPVAHNHPSIYQPSLRPSFHPDSHRRMEKARQEK